MSSHPYPQYTYPDYNDYPVEQPYDYGNPTSPSSFGGGSYAMTATNSTRSMSSTAESPSAWEWDAQNQYYTYDTMSSTPQVYSPLPEDSAYTPRQYYQPVQQPPPAQESPRRQRNTTESVPAALICLHPGCKTRGRFQRKADLHRHMNTVHEVPRRWNCPRPLCDRKGERGFSRKDHLYEHQRNTHGVEVATAGGEKKKKKKSKAVTAEK